MNAERNETRWLKLADAVSAGVAINWDEAEHQAADAEEFQVLRALRSLDEIARVHSTLTPATPSSDRQTDDPPKETAAAVPLEGIERWQHLVLLQHIGQGAFGSVYRARDERLDCDVAVKLLWPKYAAAATDNSLAVKEARLLARVRHANVVTVYGAEIADGRIGIWMELIKGRTLSDVLTAQGPFGAREAAAIGLDLCSALAAVHGVGLLHRDVKARNVMREDGGRIVLMDFGAGTDLASSANTHDLAGTPLYLAPELFDGQPATAATDIYSLGVLLYYLVSGAYPVEGSTHEEIAKAHGRHEFKPLRDRRPDLPEGFVRVIERALATQPDDRYASAGSFAQALGASVGFASTRSPLDQRSTDEVARPTSARLRSSVLAAAAVLVVASAAGLFWWKTGARSTGAAQSSSGAAVQSQSAPVGGVTDAGLGPLPDQRQVSRGEKERKRGRAPFRRERRARRPAVPHGGNLGADLRVRRQPGRQGRVAARISAARSDRGAGLARRHGESDSRDDGEGRGTYWQVTSAGGREHFYVVASPERLVAFEKTVAALPRPRYDQPVLPLSREAVGMLRSVGGLAKAAPATDGSVSSLIPLATPLLDTAETVRGYWARKITLENPIKQR